MATSLSLDRDDIIGAALRRCGVLSEGETASTSQLTDAATALNVIVKEFDAAPWFKWFIGSAETTVATAAGTPNHTLASDVLWVEAAVYDDGTNHYPMKEITVAEYAHIQQKTVQGLPQYYFVSYDLATPVLYCWPAPSATATINYWYRRKIDAFDNAADTSDFPESAYRLLIMKLAVDLGFEYGIPDQKLQFLIQAYSEALTNIMSIEGKQVSEQTVTRETQGTNDPIGVVGNRPIITPNRG